MIRNLNILVSLTLILLLSNCSFMDIACLDAGEGISHKTTKTYVMGASPNYDPDNPSGYWTDTGLSVGGQETLPVEVKGEINLCPDPDNSNARYSRKIIVPAKFCSDNSIPDYNQESENLWCTYGFGGNRVYVDTGMTTKAGEFIKIQLVPKEIIIDDCAKIPENVIMNEDDEVTGAAGQLLTRHFICNIGGNTTVSGQEMPIGPFVGKKLQVLVTNDMSPYGNKATFRGGAVSSLWISNVIDKDLRAGSDIYNYASSKGGGYSSTGLPSLDNQAKAQNISRGIRNICSAPYSKEFLSHDNYSINDICGNICNADHYRNGSRCLATVKHRDMLTTDINERNYASGDDEDLYDKIVGLAVRIGGSDLQVGGTDFDGIQCLPSEAGGNCSDISYHNHELYLNKRYEVAENVPYDSPLMLGIVSDGSGSRGEGGYHVNVIKECWQTQGEGLYIYISEDGQAPDFLPGETGEDGEEAISI